MSTEITTNNLSAQQNLVLDYLEDGLSVIKIAEKLGVTRGRIYAIQKTLTDEIISRQRERLAVGTIKAVDTMIEMLDANETTQKGELRLKAAEGIMSRSGLTNHTSVEVMIESENGIFILPGKSIVPSEESLEIDITPIND
tara:strand:- start:491 stop:913 length:423 start_codon:yes stop_codon:yes gene_type:complete